MSAQSPPRPVETVEHGPLRVDRYRLDNGLTVLHQPEHRAPVVSYQTWFRVGSRHERPGKTGIAHLFEHLMFKGTAKHPEGEFDRIIEGLGGRNNAATWLDWTYYYEEVPRDGLDTIIGLEADRMQNTLLGPDQIETEREVVMNERRERVDDDPTGRLAEILWHAAYDVHPYGRPTIGWMDDIAGLTADDIHRFYRTWYAPNNAVITVAGDVEAAPLMRAIEAAYGHMPAAELPPIEPVAEPPRSAPRRIEQALPLGAERLLMGWHAPAATDPRAAALEVLNEALFEGDSSRLQRALVTDGELAAGFYAFVPAFREPGLYEVSVDLREGVSSDAAEETVLAAFAAVARDGLGPAELAKAKNRLETRFYRQLQSAQQRAAGFGYWEVTADHFGHLFHAAEMLEKVGHDDVIEVARDILRPEARTVVRGVPT